MTKEELMTYYKEHKNINDEITLIGRATGLRYTFRHYIEYVTVEDYWLHINDGLLLDTIRVLEKYEIPCTSKQYNRLFNSLKVGDIIVSVIAEDIKSYYKKIDEDVFIECDNAGHIKSSKYIEGFRHRIKFLFNSEEIIKLSDMVERGKGV